MGILIALGLTPIPPGRRLLPRHGLEDLAALHEEAEVADAVRLADVQRRLDSVIGNSKGATGGELDALSRARDAVQAAISAHDPALAEQELEQLAALHADVRATIAARRHNRVNPLPLAEDGADRDDGVAYHDALWEAFQNHVDRTGQAPKFELIAAGSAFKNLGAEQRDGPLRRAFVKMSDIWRHSTAEHGKPAGDGHRGEFLGPDQMKKGAWSNRVKDVQQEIYGRLEADFGRPRAQTMMRLIETGASLNAYYQVRDASASTAADVEKAARRIIDELRKRHDEQARKATRREDGSIDTSKWKSDAVRRDREEHRKVADAQLTKVIHHKLPRQFIGKLAELLTPKQLATLCSRLAIGGRRDMLSLGSNLVLGPKERGDETGQAEKGSGKGVGVDKGIAAFDANKHEDGTSTPRSQALEQVYEMLYEMLKQDRAEPLGDDEFGKICDLLEQAEKYHYAQSGGKVLESPEGHWEADADKGGQLKKKPQPKRDTALPPEPLAQLKGRSVPLAQAPEYLSKPSSSPEAERFEAVRKRCSAVWRQLAQVRHRIAETDGDEAVDLDADRRMRAFQQFPYALDLDTWALQSEAWAKDCEAWAAGKLSGL